MAKVVFAVDSVVEVDAVVAGVVLSVVKTIVGETRIAKAAGVDPAIVEAAFVDAAVVEETVVDGNSFNLCLKVSRQSLPLSSELNACWSDEIDAGVGDVRGTGLLNRNPG